MEEGGGTATYTVTLVDKAGEEVTIPSTGTDIDVSVTWTGLADISDLDTTALSLPSTITIEAGTNHTDFKVTGLDDYMLEGDEPLTATITSVTQDATTPNFEATAVSTVAGENTATTTIQDDEIYNGSITDDNQTVYEYGLTDGDTNTGAEFVSGSFNVSTNAQSGIQTVVVGGTTIIQNGVLVGNISSTNINTGKGIISIDGFDGSEVTYTYKLSDNVDHSSGSVTDEVAISMTDSIGTKNANINISIVDDSPTISYVTSAVVENDITAADFSGVWYSNVGADDNNGFVRDINITLDNANDLGISTTVTSFDGNSTVLTGKDGSGADYFTVTVNKDGTYDFDLIKKEPSSFVTEGTVIDKSIGGNVYERYLDEIVEAKYNQTTADNLKVDIKFTSHDGYVLNSDSTYTLGTAVTVNTSNNGLGSGGSTGGLAIGLNESMTLTFIENPAGSTHSTTSKPIDSVLINFGNNAGNAYSVQNATVIVHYSDNTISVRDNISGQSSYEVEAVENKQIISVDVINRGTDDFLINGVTTGFIASTINPDDTNFDFTIDVVDTDGDSDSYSFGIGIDSKGNLTGTTLDDAILGTSSDDTIVGDSGDDIIDGAAGNDNINAGTGNDILLGGTGDDILNGDTGNDSLDGGIGADENYGGIGNDSIIYDSNDTVIDGGTGTDSLILAGSNDSIDFSNLGSTSIDSIENIDLTSSGSQSISNLTLADVVDMVDSTGDKVLKITGDSSDNVSLKNEVFNNTDTGEWSKANSTETVDNIEYDVYTNTSDNTYKVLVQTDINDNISN